MQKTCENMDFEKGFLDLVERGLKKYMGVIHPPFE